MNDTFTSFVSVVIPVYNDSERLEICLRSLENQTYPKNQYEVIVVDNGSDDRLEEFVYRFDQTIFAQENHPGSYAARNKGISVAKGDIIAFTDSDCIPRSDWIESGVSNILAVPNCGMLVGKIDIFFKKPDKPTAVEVYESIKSFQTRRYLENGRHGVTANLFTFKSVIAKVGLFNAELKSGGDVEWGKRVFSSGYQQIYADNTCVAHPARRSFRELYRKTTRIVGGFHDWKGNTAYSLIDFSKDLIKMTRSSLGFIKLFIFNMSPSEKFDGTMQKIKFIVVKAFVDLVRIFEKVRLTLGGSSRR